MRRTMETEGGWGTSSSMLSFLFFHPVGRYRLQGYSGHQKLAFVGIKFKAAFQYSVQRNPLGYRTGNGEKVSRTQAEPGQAINSAVV